MARGPSDRTGGRTGGRRGAEVLEFARRLDAGTILVSLLVAGFVLRVFIAGVYLPLSGFSIDIGDFTAWGQRLASLGPAEFYAEGYFSDYPPGYLYVLWLLGELGAALVPLVGQDATAGLVKIPGIVADVGVAWLLFVIARRWAAQLISRRGVGPETLGIAAATIYLFNPGTVFDSAVWGQIDSVGTLAVLGTLYALGRGWTELASAGAVLAMLLKFQFALVIPIVAVVGIKRHLFGRSSDPSHARRREPGRVLTSLVAGVGVLVILMLPFGMTLYVPLPGGDPNGLLGVLPEADPTRSLIGKLVEAASTYTGLSINAFNLWRNPWSGLGDTLHWGDDTLAALTIGSAALTWQQVSTIGFALLAAVALWQVARRDDMRGLLLASLLLAVAFFVVPTRVHERYLFPALALAAPLLFAWRAWPWVYAGLSLSFFANIYWVYTEDWSFAGGVINPGANGIPMPQDPFLTATLLTDGGIWLLSALSVVLLGVVIWRAARLALSRTAVPEAEAEPMPAPPQHARRSAPVAGDWEARPGEVERPAPTPAPVSWLKRNPADAYLGEPARRLDRRDALLLIGLVVLALVFRLWRLDVPRGHHFDEVYHARSATEWLANWRNGWDRDVYEWTHPMLAKYLIAAGIAIADPNQVEGATTTPAPAITLAVAPARASRGFERSVSFGSSGDARIVARDADSGEELTGWSAGGPIASLAYDPGGERLLVGRADDGSIETYELAGYLAAPDGRAPPAGPTIDVDLEAATQVVVPDDAGVVLIRGPDGLAVIDRETDDVTARADGTYSGAAYVAAGDDEGAFVAVTDPARGAVLLLDGETLQVRLDEEGEELGVLAVNAPLVGPLVSRGTGDDRQVFALTGPIAATDEHPATSGGIAAVDADQETLADLVPLPGAASLVGHQRVANVLYVAGTTASGEPAVWTLDPHLDVRDDSSAGLAAFDETALPGPALAMAFDVAGTAQADDHGRLLLSVAEADGGALVRIDAGSNAFAWRVAGVVFGSILAGLVYLLAATLFGRRRIAVLAAAFVAIDGMSYAMSRIAMNDIFVAVFIVAAYLLFWQIWSGRWARSAWWVLPAVGVLIGLAAATKWVGFYALAGIWILALARSGLGRVLLLALVALAAVVGGIGAPWPFGVAMLLALGIGLAYVHVRPIRLDLEEVRLALPATGVVLGGMGLALALAVGQVEGRQPGSGVEYLFALLARGAEAGWPAWLMLGVAALLVGWRAWRSLRDPRSDARWWSPGEMGGFAWSWIGACLVMIPLTVYALSYVPYLQLGHSWAIPETGPGYGWSLEELHSQMFGYHFNLTASHASSSPWWSWPLALKPTWFFNGTYDADRIAVIYNGGNPLLFWAGVPAIVAAGVLAWRRRSAALVLLVAAFAFQLVPWTRIERATFAYHYLTAVIFAMIAVAYVVDELLRRPAWRELAIGYLALVVVVGLLIFPLGSALPMPDWYINAARALPPWNFGFQFPDPPTGERGELFSVSGLKLLLGLVVAAAAVGWSLYGRVWAPSLVELLRPRRRVPE